VQSQQVSVVIPAYNREQYIGEAIESVLAQGVDDLEIIVVDNNSTDKTAEIALSYPKVNVISESAQGVAYALNGGVRAATGYWLAFLDSDDLWTPNKLKAQFAALSEQPEHTFALGYSQNFLDPNTPAASVPAKVGLRPLPGYHVSTLLIRAETFRKVGSFDETLKVAPPIDWFMRALDAGLQPQMVNEVVHRRRIHANNYARDRSAADYMIHVRRTMERRRAQHRTSDD